MIVQGYSVWKLRGALDWKKLWPFVMGAAFGVPIGVTILTWTNPAHVRIGVGAFLARRMGGAKRYPSIASYGDDGFRRLNPSYVLRRTDQHDPTMHHSDGSRRTGFLG